MNRISTMVAATALFACGPALAGAQPVPFNWTGFYAGAYAGYGSSNVTATDLGDQFGTAWYILGHQFTASPTSFIGGGEVGYNYQMGRFVFGVEADAGYFNHNGSALYDNTPPHSDTSVVANGSINSRLRGRMGFAADRALFYATGGLAATNTSAQVISFGSFMTPIANLQMGWTAGGGVEYALTDNWSVKLEYLHDDFGSATAPLAGASSSFRIQSTDDSVRFGVNYLFK